MPALKTKKPHCEACSDVISEMLTLRGPLTA